MLAARSCKPCRYYSKAVVAALGLWRQDAKSPKPPRLVYLLPPWACGLLYWRSIRRVPVPPSQVSLRAPCGFMRSIRRVPIPPSQVSLRAPYCVVRTALATARGLAGALCGRLREIVGARSPTAPVTPHPAIFRAPSRFGASCVWQNLRAVGSARRSWRALLSVLAGDPSQARERLPEPPHSMWLFAPFWSRLAPSAPPPPSGRAVSPTASALLSAGAVLWGNTFPPPLFAAPWGWKSLPRH